MLLTRKWKSTGLDLQHGAHEHVAIEVLNYLLSSARYLEGDVGLVPHFGKHSHFSKLS